MNNRWFAVSALAFSLGVTSGGIGVDPEIETGK
jgi:hypothetical protein